VNKQENSPEPLCKPINRRRFVQGLAVSGGIAALNLKGIQGSDHAKVQSLKVLSGDHFHLVIDSMPVNFTGRRSLATAVNGSVPGPILRWREGDTVTLAVTNRLRTTASIHWHAIRLPSGMDGVPGLSFPGIEPNQTFVYRIPVVQHGTSGITAIAAFRNRPD
jgi:FtsP/CotA-like multicopper oxidase with cupredoxin domain